MVYTVWLSTVYFYGGTRLNGTPRYQIKWQSKVYRFTIWCNLVIYDKASITGCAQSVPFPTAGSPSFPMEQGVHHCISLENFKLIQTTSAFSQIHTISLDFPYVALSLSKVITHTLSLSLSLYFGTKLKSGCDGWNSSSNFTRKR